MFHQYLSKLLSQNQMTTPDPTEPSQRNAVLTFYSEPHLNINAENLFEL
jgi:hypothetical protein